LHMRMHEVDQVEIMYHAKLINKEQF